MKMKKENKNLYKTNKESKIYDIIECPVCHAKFKKIQWSQAFCCSKCKDKYHNMHNKDRHRYIENFDNDMTDRDWDEIFRVAEYNY